MRSLVDLSTKLLQDDFHGPMGFPAASDLTFRRSNASGFNVVSAHHGFEQLHQSGSGAQIPMHEFSESRFLHSGNN